MVVGLDRCSLLGRLPEGNVLMNHIEANIRGDVCHIKPDPLKISSAVELKMDVSFQTPSFHSLPQCNGSIDRTELK